MHAGWIGDNDLVTGFGQSSAFSAVGVALLSLRDARVPLAEEVVGIVAPFPEWLNFRNSSLRSFHAERLGKSARAGCPRDLGRAGAEEGSRGSGDWVGARNVELCGDQDPPRGGSDAPTQDARVCRRRASPTTSVANAR